MSALVLTSDSLSGSPASGNIEYSGQFYGTDTNNSRAQMQRITQGTAVASTSGTSIDFTSIPSWVKRITVMFSSMSTSGTSNYLIQIGSGSITATGYLSGSGYVSTSVNNTTTGTTGTTGFVMYNGSPANALHGACILMNVSGNIWDSTHTIGSTSGIIGIMSGSGVLTLGGDLDRVRITTVNGTDTFDAGSINILYEG